MFNEKKNHESKKKKNPDYEYAPITQPPISPTISVESAQSTIKYWV